MNDQPEPESPAEVLAKAKPGDKVRISLRGPHSPDEIEEIRETHEREYPGVEFEFTWDDDVISVEKVDRG